MEKKKYKVLLVAPYGNIPNYWFPMALGYLKSSLAATEYTVKLIDGTFLAMPAQSAAFRTLLKDFDPDMVGISTGSLTYDEALLVAKEAKVYRKSTATIMGGPQPTLYPENVLKDKNVDFVFRGEAEKHFPLFIKALIDGDDFSEIRGLVYRDGEKVKMNPLYMEEDLDTIAPPDYVAMDIEAYIAQGYNYGGFYGKSAPIWTTRGCPYNCKFCSAPSINGRKMRMHSAAYLVTWITDLYNRFNIRQFSIVDDNFTFYLDYAKDFCRKIISLRESGHFAEKIFFTTPNGIRLDRVDKELLELMRKAGWMGVSVAPESGSPRVLKLMGKSIKPALVPGYVKMIREAGLAVRGFFIVGFPGETLEDIALTKKLIRACTWESLNIQRFVPFPGTPAFNDLVEQGEIPPDYIPPQNFKLYTPFQKDTENKMYITAGFENFSLFRMLLVENILATLKNPRSIIYFFKYYGFISIIKKLLYLLTGR